MPLLDDIMDNPIIGPMIRARIEIGRKEGRRQGARRILLLFAEKRFGPVPDWAIQKIDALSQDDLEDAAVEALDTPSLEVLLP